MALLSLLFLLLAIFLGFVRKMNTGLLCIAFALVLGRMSGVSDAVIMKGFNSSLFIMLLGVTYLFSMAQINGSLDLLAQKVIALAGRRVYLIPIIIYVFSIVLAALGPGSVPTMAIMMVFSMSLAAEMKISPVLLSTLTVLGSCAGGLSPLAATGIIGANLCAEFGLTGIENDFLLNGVFSFTVYAVIVYVWLGGYKLRAAEDVGEKVIPSFNRKQLLTIAGIVAMVFMVMLLHINVGLVSFAVAAVLSFLRVSEEAKAIRHIPWNTLLLITGVGVLMQLIIDLGGINILSAALVSIMSAKSAAAVMGLTSGIMSWFSSSSGVVMPTLLPTVPHIAQQLGGVNELELASSITTISHVAAISPLSTGGALALAAYASAANANQKQQQNLFMKMFGVSALGVSVLCVFSYFGMFHWLL
ncbi:SLC13 family permease [Phascolarctobacterium sp.]|uniref:SLC13 family permease n=1 Tax=Phascolarctobacterium sp. TaxID=2049039 RepID=UPI0025F6E71F|nr:SLC13 family permease [Phascolarctobacterium sp.]